MTCSSRARRARAGLAPGVVASLVIAAAATFLLAALRRAGDAVRLAARHGDELPRRARDIAAPGIDFAGAPAAAHRRRPARLPDHRSARSPRSGWPPVLLVVGAVDADHPLLGRCWRGRWASTAVRPAVRRRDRDLRRLGGDGAVGRAAGASAQGARDPVHHRRRVDPVDAGDDPLSRHRRAGRARRDARRPVHRRRRSTTSPRSSAPATPSRPKPATPRPWSS